MVAKTKGNVKNQYRVKNPAKQEKPTENQKAVTITESGPKNSLARVDGYGQTDSTIPTNFYSTISKYADSFFGSFDSKGFLPDFKSFDLTSLKGIVEAGKKVASIDIEAIKHRVEESVLGGRSIESLLNLPKQFKEDAFGTLAGLVGNTTIAGANIGRVLRDTKMSYADAMGIYNMVKNGDWTSFSGIVNSLGALQNANTNSLLGKLVGGYIDIQATSAFLGSLVRTASQFGNTALIKEIMNKFQDKREGRRYLNATLYGCCVGSDIPTINYILDYIGEHVVSGNNPILVRWILQHYQLDGMYQPSKIVEYKDRLVKLLNRVDPEWYFTYQDNEKITKLEPFQWCSKDAQWLLSYVGEQDTYDFTTEFMIAKSYPEQDIKQLVMRTYKDIAFKDRPLDPRYKR